MPFCPNCRTEYASQTEFCETCDSRLVDSLPNSEEDDEKSEAVELATFSNVSEAEMIREILEKNGIQTIQRGEVDPIGVASGAEPITLLVEERHRPRARELYDAYFAGDNVENSGSDQD